MAKRKLKTVESLLRLDLGCGRNKREGFTGVDQREFEGVDQVHDLTEPWPWADESVEEVHCSHFIEHLNAKGRVHFVNELYRVLIPEGKATVIVPHWASERAYGDLTHEWPPVSEMWFFYLNREWRKDNAPHNDFYKCDFQATWGYSLRQDASLRNQETVQFWLMNYKGVAEDIIATLVKR